MNEREIKGFVFDMDNTLLRSNINFKAMKSDVYAFLAGHGAISPDIREDEHTTSTLIETARSAGTLSESFERDVWFIVRGHEIEGMKDARLEPHVSDVLSRLYGHYILTVLTNNAYDAALSALERNGIIHLFDTIMGREQVPSLKPSPCGVMKILESYPSLSPQNWVCTGDSWIDGKSAQDADIGFISYRGNIAKMNDKGVYPLHTIQDMYELFDILEKPIPF